MMGDSIVLEIGLGDLQILKLASCLAAIGLVTLLMHSGHLQRLMPSNRAKQNHKAGSTDDRLENSDTLGEHSSMARRSCGCSDCIP